MKKILESLIKLLPAALLVLLFSTFLPNNSPVFALPPNFTKTTVAGGFNNPTDFAFIPDGRILVTEQFGNVKVIKNGSILPNAFLSLSVDGEGERGLLGVVVDPQFSSNKFVYISYVNKNPLELRVSRFTTNGDTADPSSEKILLKSTKPLNLIHQSGGLRFGPDGKLWISIGNNDTRANSQDLSNIHGKLLRINKDGTIPQDNPFAGQSGKEGAIWAYGLRNPFRFNFLLDGQIILGDVGDFSWEELNIIIKGGNYGYPFFEGSCGSCQYINPVHAYPHNGQSAAVVSGFQYSGDKFPPDLPGSYFFGDFAMGFIKSMEIHEDGVLDHEEMFDEAAGTVVQMAQGTDGSLYFLTIYPGALLKINFASGNLPPVAKISANPTSGNIPLSVQFSSEGSNDPENSQLSYSWDFGDGSTSKEANPSHKYTSKGKFTAKLTVSDGHLNSETVSLEIFAGNNAPQINFFEPQNQAKYNAGQTINYSANATDPEDGTLPTSAFSWKIFFHHGTHIHPFLGPIDNVKSGSFKIPDTGEESADTWYEIELTVTDSQGLKTVDSREIFPNKVTLTFNTDPQGLGLTIDGLPVTAPHSQEAVVGFKFTLDAPSQTKADENFEFDSWSDDRTKTHQITTPQATTTYTAKFKSTGLGTGNLRFRVAEFGSNQNWLNKYINDVIVKLTDTSGNTVFVSKSTTKRSDGEDGWVEFNGLSPGTYGVLAYKSGSVGVWKKLNCQNPQGSFDNATIQNSNTEGFKAAWNNNITVVSNQTTWCTDLGLASKTTGNLRVRILNVTTNGSSYTVNGFINGATVKLTDITGNTVSKTLTSGKAFGNEDGWALFENTPEGTFGLIAHKAGFKGFLKKTSCSIEDTTNATIKNQNTDELTAAWNNNVAVQGGKTTYCFDLGLAPDAPQTGNLKVRVAEFGVDRSWINKYINDVKVKLTDASGSTVIKTLTSTNAFGSEEGWAQFDDVPAGTYGIMAYKSGYVGVWKKLNCQNPQGSFDNATINNQNTEGLTASWNENVAIVSDQTTWCTDLGLKSNTKGSLRVRITEFNSNKSWKGTYINGATLKLTDTAGNTVIQTLTSANAFGAEEGWVLFDNIDQGTYGVMAYKSGYEGFWKKLNCQDPQGSFEDATIQNSNTEVFKAAWNNNAKVIGGQITWCNDLGLIVKSIPSLQSQPLNFDNLDSTELASPSATLMPSPSLKPIIELSSPSPFPSITPALLPQISPSPTPSQTPSPSQSASPTPQPSSPSPISSINPIPSSLPTSQTPSSTPSPAN